MSTETHTMAGMHAAGVARLGAVAGHVCHPATPAIATTLLATAVPQGVLVAQGAAAYGIHQSASWTKGAIAKPATFMVFDRKNRPTRPLSECSP
ncbi:MAG: hypothetical protein M3Z03_16450 [Actinomycetota bacterium]|nr:hypothetical protein [Actinomycetota bacterium]